MMKHVTRDPCAEQSIYVKNLKTCAMMQHRQQSMRTAFLAGWQIRLLWQDSRSIDYDHFESDQFWLAHNYMDDRL